MQQLSSLRLQQRAPASSLRCQAVRAQAQPVKAVPREAQQQLAGAGSRLAAGLLGAAAAVTLALGAPAHAAEPFLKSTGALRGGAL